MKKQAVPGYPNYFYMTSSATCPSDPNTLTDLGPMRNVIYTSQDFSDSQVVRDAVLQEYKTLGVDCKFGILPEPQALIKNLERSSSAKDMNEVRRKFIKDRYRELQNEVEMEQLANKRLK